MIVRFEPWGAWVRLDRQDAIVALDRDGTRALGLDGGARWSDAEAPVRAPLEVSLAVTSRCGAGCDGCYLDARADGKMAARSEIEAALDALAEAGVFTVAFGGGEPTLRDDLGELADAARARRITPIVTTSGLGLGDRKLAQLTRFAQVNVSYDGGAESYRAVRGFDGAAAAESAIVRLAAAGVKVGVNIVLTAMTWPRVKETVARAVSLGATDVQLLRYKPAGRARTLDYLEKRLAPEQAVGLGALLRELTTAHEGQARVRIDCALVPFLSADAELSARPDDLARWGIFGCEAGQLLGAATIDGRLAPCSFLAPSDLGVGDLASWSTLAPAPPVEPCASCTLVEVCKGGCKAVSGGGPDPECPRVRAS